MSGYQKQNMKIEGFAIENSSKYVLVIINPADSKRQVQFELLGKLWYAELLPESISTIVLE